MTQIFSSAAAPAASTISERVRRRFQLLVLVSGFCGISYEILYGRILSNFIGDQFAVSASVLLTFLLGIGVGAVCAHRLWGFLWLIEGVIGLCGTMITLGAPYLDRWLYLGAYGTSGLSWAILICLLIITVPAFLIGCSLALFPGYLSRLSDGPVFARAYCFYNLGAAATALLIEFWLVRNLGIRGTVMVIASLNAAVSLTLLVAFRELRQMSPTAAKPVDISVTAGSALAVASMASAIFQLLMIKLAEFLLGPFRETFALILALILAGIALGSASAEKFRIRFGLLLLAGIASCAWLVSGFGWLATSYALLRPLVADSHLALLALKLALLAVLMGPTAIIFGATIPALLYQEKEVARESGRLLFISSVANALGFLLMAFLLHRHFDYGALIVLVAGLTALAAVIAGAFNTRVAAAGAALLIAVVLLHRTLWEESVLYLGHTAFYSSRQLARAKTDLRQADKFKGHQDVFALTRTQDNVQFFINGYVSISLHSPAEKLVGAFSTLFAPRMDRALVLGLGSGATGGTVALLFDQVDAVEINPVVIENLFRMAEYNFAVHSRPNVRVIVDDGNHFARVTEHKYSLIINTVTTPLYFSSAKLYTYDFLQSVRRIMTPDGVYVTWIDSRVGDRGLDITLKTLRRAFENCWLGAIKSSYFLLICSQQPIALRQPRAIETNPVLANYFAQNGLPAEWISYGLLSTKALSLSGDPRVPVNTHDYPALEFEIARLSRRGIDGFKHRLLASMDLEDVGTALRALPFDPARLTLYMDSLLGDSAIAKQWMKLAASKSENFAGRYTEAKLAHLAAQAATRKTAESYNKYGAALSEAARYGEAIKQFKTALSLGGIANNTLSNLGAAYESSGALEAALESYTQELTVNAHDAEAAYRQGRVLYKLKRFNAALSRLEAAAQRRNTANTQYYLGLTWEALGRRADARTAYMRALGLNHQHGAARAALARLQGPSSRTGG